MFMFVPFLGCARVHSAIPVVLKSWWLIPSAAELAAKSTGERSPILQGKRVSYSVTMCYLWVSLKACFSNFNHFTIATSRNMTLLRWYLYSPVSLCGCVCKESEDAGWWKWMITQRDTASCDELKPRLWSEERHRHKRQLWSNAIL